MSTRAFRARPVDPNRPLPIVRDLGLLDSAEGLPAREVVHNHAALDADNEKVTWGEKNRARPQPKPAGLLALACAFDRLFCVFRPRSRK